MAGMATGTDEPSRSERDRQVAGFFLRLGFTAFGGPAVHIALMHDEVVERREWLNDQQFLDLLGATNLIPGPNSTEMAIHIGYLRAGWPGLILGGACFILPSMLIVLAPGLGLRRFGRPPQAGWLFYGIKPVIIAIILQGACGHGAQGGAQPYNRADRAGACLVLNLFGVNELVLLVGGGLAVMLAGCGRCLQGGLAALLPLAGLGSPGSPFWTVAAAAAAAPLRAGAALPDLPQDRRGALRQRVRAAGLPARRLCYPPGLADRPADRRRRGGRAVHARAALHHRHLHRLPARWACRARCSPRWASSCRVHLCRR